MVALGIWSSCMRVIVAVMSARVVSALVMLSILQGGIARIVHIITTSSLGVLIVRVVADYILGWHLMVAITS